MHTTQSPAAAEETEKLQWNLKYDEETETNQTKHPADSLDELGGKKFHPEAQTNNSHSDAHNQWSRQQTTL